MKLWRLVRSGHVALDGAGTLEHGGRYSPPGMPVVNFASEAALAVLIALRYQPRDLLDAAGDHVLGWIEIDAAPERMPLGLDENAIRSFVAKWLEAGQSLLMALPSKVLPEADVIMMNVRHRDAPAVPPLVVRPFSFAACLHAPPMLERYGGRP